MTWEQKLQAMTALVGSFSICLRMREPGNWYVAGSGRNIIGGGICRSTFGDGSTPQEAVEDDWRIFVDELPLNRAIAVHYGDAERRRIVRWNGFMWQDVAHPDEGK
jgi:hypothetical protein